MNRTGSGTEDSDPVPDRDHAQRSHLLHHVDTPDRQCRSTRIGSKKISAGLPWPPDLEWWKTGTARAVPKQPAYRRNRVISLLASPRKGESVDKTKAQGATTEPMNIKPRQATNGLRTAALLEFPATVTGTGIIATHFGGTAPQGLPRLLGWTAPSRTRSVRRLIQFDLA